MSGSGYIIASVFGYAGALLAGVAHGSDARPIDAAFASTTIHVTAMPQDVGVPVEWRFTNHWDFPLLIEKFDESCGCLSGNMQPQHAESVAPGESGTIRASFTPGQHRGLLRKSLHVRFVGHKHPVELIVEATIPIPIEFSARELSWTAGAPIEPQSIDITTGTGADFAITGLSGVAQSQFLIKQETLTEKRHYRITITPAEGVAPGVHTLLIRTNSPDPRDRVSAIFLSIP